MTEGQVETRIEATSPPDVVAPDEAGERQRSKRSLLRRALGALASLAIAGGLLIGVLPQLADFNQVWEAIRALSWWEAAALFAAAAWAILTYLFVMIAALPGLSLGQAFVVSQLSTAVTNTLPAGGAVGLGVTYTMYSSFGHGVSAIALAAVLTGLWNMFVKLGLPIVAFSILAVRGNPNPALLSAALIGLAILLIAIGIGTLILASQRLAYAIGNGMGRLASAIVKPFRREPITGWGASLAEFRSHSVALLRKRWHWLTLASVVSYLSLFGLLMLSLRLLGVRPEQVTWAEALAAFALVQLINSVPITPGGLGVVEVGLTAGLVVAGGPQSLVVAAVLIYRALSYVLQVPLGLVSFVIWKFKKSWRQPASPPPESLA